MFKDLSTTLEYLDLSGNYLGLNNDRDNSTIILGQSLSYLKKLKALKLANSGLGSLNGSPRQIRSFTESIANMTYLTHLDFSDNEIGNSPEGEQALLESLVSLSSLEEFNLDNNDIGRNNPQSGAMIPQILINNKRLNDFRINQVTGANWTQGAQAIQGRVDADLQSKCESEICYGNLNTSQTTNVDIKINSNFNFSTGLTDTSFLSFKAIDDFYPSNSIGAYRSPYEYTEVRTSSLINTLPQVMLVAVIVLAIYKAFHKVWKRIW